VGLGTAHHYLRIDAGVVGEVILDTTEGAALNHFGTLGAVDEGTLGDVGFWPARLHAVRARAHTVRVVTIDERTHIAAIFREGVAMQREARLVVQAGGVLRSGVCTWHGDALRDVGSGSGGNPGRVDYPTNAVPVI